MARVNHKLVKQRLNENRSKITDSQFFTSRLLAGHYEDMASAQTRRYMFNRRVKVFLEWEPKKHDIAVTDNDRIYINSGNKLVTDVAGRMNRYNIVTGLFAHELGHILYTDFLAMQTYFNYFDSYNWYPVPPVFSKPNDAVNEKSMWEYVKADNINQRLVKRILHDIFNILEDGYIENRILNNFPGTLGYSLEKLRELHFEKIPTVTKQKEIEDMGKAHILDSIFQNVLAYTKYGEIKYGDEPLTDIRIKTVFELISDIDNALLTRSIKERFKTSNLILIRCWDYIKDYCEECKKRHEEQNGDNSGDVEGMLSGVLSSLTGSSTIGNGNSTPVLENESETLESATADKRTETNAAARKQEGASVDSSCNSNESTDELSESSDGNSGKNELGNTSDIGAVNNSGTNTGKQDVTDEEGGRIPLQETDNLSASEGGTIEKNSEYERTNYENAAKDIERILDKMAEKSACNELENERLQEMNEFAKNISYGNIHKGVNIRVNRIASVDDALVDQYNAVSRPLLGISKRLQKSIMQQLKDVRRGGKQTGLMYGRRLDSHAIHRNDGKVFCKNSLPTEAPQLAVGLLLDESGSMSSCDRATYARAAAIILYDFCDSLDIPVMVYGHSTSSRENVELYSYAEFDSFEDKDKYRLMDISARGCNRDGAALRYVAERLSKREESVKILILVSDGQPADTGYYGTAAEEDLRGIQQEYKRKGILFVAAAIGDDKQNIERIYGDAFLDITDLNQLPTKLTSVVKRHIRL